MRTSMSIGLTRGILIHYAQILASIHKTLYTDLI